MDKRERYYTLIDYEYDGDVVMIVDTIHRKIKDTHSKRLKELLLQDVFRQ